MVKPCIAHLFTSALLYRVSGHAHSECFDSALAQALERPSSWMGRLGDLCPGYFQKRQLTDITLPASHDAGSYASGVRDDPCETNMLVRLALGKDTCKKWFITQSGNIEEQLRAGSRYLDLRMHWRSGGVCAWKGGKYTPDCWSVWHPSPMSYVGPLRVPGMEFASFVDVVQQLQSFLQAHPKELVIVRLKLQQFVAKNMFGWENREKNRKEIGLVGEVSPKTAWCITRGCTGLLLEICDGGKPNRFRQTTLAHDRW